MVGKPKRNYTIEEGMHGRDLFRTPHYATKLLVPFVPMQVRVIWECAVGDGKIKDVFEMFGYPVIGTDVRTDLCAGTVYLDFIKDKFEENLDTVGIVTNPPFSIKKQFYLKCIEYDIPFALLIPGDYTAWLIEAIDKYGCEKIIPTRRIDYITPFSKEGSSSEFHSIWLTRYFNLGKSETFVELTQAMKKDIEWH